MQELDQPRAQRRHERARVKAKRRFFWGRDHSLPGEEKSWGRLISTPTPCSCPLCGSPRKHFGERSIAERRFDQKERFSDVPFGQKTGRDGDE